MKNSDHLPISGPLPRPSGLEEARSVLRREAFPAPDVQKVKLTALEFSSVCPKTGQPDFGSVVIEYEPDKSCLESKAVKFYLWAYRDEGAFCENLAATIADDIVEAIEPRSVRVDIHQNSRGGIELVATALR